jgi:fatty-acyl-CoA synthase
LHTGDLGVLDENDRLTYVGRLKDMIKVGGENVAALEIEAYLITHPSVKIAQVVGVPDERYDEVPAAFIELNPGAEVSESDIIDYCRGRIASFKVPRHVRFVREWPMSSTKIQKYRLRESIIAELDEVPREETSAV